MFGRLDRVVPLTVSAVLLLAAVAWLTLVLQAGALPMSPAGHGMPSGGDAAAFLASWAVMMAAMMLPSAAPMIGLYAGMHRNSARREGAVPPWVFTSVYLAVWTMVGVPVYLVTVAVATLAEQSTSAAAALPYAVAAVLLGAGAYQLSPLKRTCLRACRSPLSFLMAGWRPGRMGTVRLALAHAAYCVGCCWALMAVLVAAGAMGVRWVLLVAALVLMEKVMPAGELTARVGGAALVLLGILVVANPDLAAILRGGGM